MNWKKRPQREETDCCRRWIYTTACGSYRVVHSRSHFGLPSVWYAQRLEQHGRRELWENISRHKVKHRATQACEKFERRSIRRAG